MNPDPQVEFHKSVCGDHAVATISGIDISEMADAYSAIELRAIARHLNNAADHLDYINNSHSTKPLFEIGA